MMVTVVSRHSFTASLLKAKHQVDPLVKVFWHVLTLQGGLVLFKEIAGIWRSDEDGSTEAEETVNFTPSRDS